jgi:cytochrome c-type biogenesis protein CcmH/NrfF
MSPIPPVAHAGHWILYLGPVLVVLVAVIAGAVRERRNRDSVDDDDLGTGPPAGG